MVLVNIGGIFCLYIEQIADYFVCARMQQQQVVYVVPIGGKRTLREIPSLALCHKQAAASLLQKVGFEIAFL